MPRYDYRCPECGAEFEATRSIAERNDVLCETCGEQAKMDIASTLKNIIWNWYPRPPNKDGFTSTWKPFKSERDRKLWERERVKDRDYIVASGI